MKNTVMLPVSIGEAMDKLTILAIKLDKITDLSKKEDIEKEYGILNTYLEPYMKKAEFFYKKLKEVNLKIWDKCELIRDIDVTNIKDEYVKLYDDITKQNDARCRIKTKINNICGSELKEHKSYKPNKALIIPHGGLGDLLWMLGAIRYLSIYYDTVTVVCPSKNYSNGLLFFHDDPSIVLLNVNSDNDVSPTCGGDFGRLNFETISQGHDTYLCGYHKNGSGNLSGELPVGFYNDCGLDPSIYTEYFYIKPDINSKLCYNRVKHKKIIFAHTQPLYVTTITDDMKKSFPEIAYNTHQDLNNELKEKYPDHIIVNVTVNAYAPEDEFYDICETLVNLPFTHYIDILLNCDEVHVYDGSFSVFSLLLLNKTPIYMYPRVWHTGIYSFLSDRHKNLTICA